MPIRVRLTVAFVLAVAAVMAGAGLFVYLRLQTDLDDAINDALSRRADSVALPADQALDDLSASAGAPADNQEGFAHVIDDSGRLVDAVGGNREPVLTVVEIERANIETEIVERRVPGVDGTTRVLARAAPTSGKPAVVAVGQSLEDRDEALSNLAASFAIGGPVAIAVAALLGWALATASLAPIEAMRRRAGEISLARRDALLPLPEARDEVRRLGQTLNEMLGRLRGAFDREREFVADASHELRTPIAVIKAELEGAMRSGEVGPGARPAVVGAIEECDSLAALAEDLLVIARGADGELPVHLEQIDARELLEGVRDRFADRAAERDRAIRIEVEYDGPIELEADPLRMRQALSNLVDNSLRYGEGEIFLRARTAGDGSGTQLDVSDSGPGFEPSMAERAFERFSRGDSARGRGGTGLGLAIVRAVAEAHGGTAEIVGGVGPTVRLMVPAPRQRHADLI